MQNSGEINDIGISPSFSYYSNDNHTPATADRVVREVKHTAQVFESYNESSDTEEEDDLDFTFEFLGEKFSSRDLESEGRILVPIFHTDLVTKDDVDEVIHDDPSEIIPVQTMLASDSESDETSSSLSLSDSSSLESEHLPQLAKLENKNMSYATPDIFHVTWRKTKVRPETTGLIKKSRSTGSEEIGSRKWRLKDMLRRSNSLGKETVYFLCPKLLDASLKKRAVKSGEGPKVAGKPKKESAASVHELFYVQKRLEQKGGNMKTYLPYKQDILGFKVHINGNSNKKLPF